MIETIISFIALILICGLAYFTTKFYAASMKRFNQTDSMQVMESMMLERDKRIMIVRIQSKYFILISHSNGVENLGECDYVEKVTLDKNPNQFEQLIQQFIRKGDKHEN